MICFDAYLLYVYICLVGVDYLSQYSYISRHPEGSVELSNLVEDKEIAARAVAFVVNGSRKGIVPLCADVANLLRAKRR